MFRPLSRLGNVARNNAARSKLSAKKQYSTQIKTETITYADTTLFPPEDGKVQSSIYGSELVVPHCRLDQFMWMDVNKWSHRTALVRVKKLNFYVTFCFSFRVYYFARYYYICRSKSRQTYRDSAYVHLHSKL